MHFNTTVPEAIALPVAATPLTVGPWAGPWFVAVEPPPHAVSASVTDIAKTDLRVSIEDSKEELNEIRFGSCDFKAPKAE